MTQVCSVFSQLLQLFSRGEFARAVKKHSAERHAKGFTYKAKPVAVFSFDQIREAQRLMESNQATGKIVVKL